MNPDILIVGSGCSGLYCALNLPENKNIAIITKADLTESDSYLAQGGICVLKDENDYDSFMEDTLKAGHYENDKTSVDIMIKSSRDVINDLIGYGVDFAKNSDGSLDYTREGAHSKERILFHKDVTGKEITSKLLNQVKKKKNIRIYEYTTLIDIIVKDKQCIGAVYYDKEKCLHSIFCEYVVLACGGIGGLYRHSTNFSHLTGDAVAIAIKHNIELKDINYIQFHPTTLHSNDEGERSFLISESVRGEGAKLYNKNEERFVNELLPRDLLTKAILEQMDKDSSDFVWEDLRTIPHEELKEHFPNIVQHCKDKNYDVTKENIPVVPAQHYFMGGIKVNYNSKTSMDRLYAIGETACNGVHGKNRLASNSLLESLVFAKRAAIDMADNPKNTVYDDSFDISVYSDIESIENEYKISVKNEIEKANSKEE